MKKLKILLMILLFLGLPTFLLASCKENEGQGLQKINFNCEDELVVGEMPEQLQKEIGENGFGYDCMFLSHDLNKPFGIASEEEKASVSHRGRAIRKFKEEIDKKYN